MIAEADDREVCEVRLVAKALSDVLADWVEVLGRDLCDLAAPLAVEVLELLAASEHPQPRAVAEVHVAHNAMSLEHLEVSVDRRDVDLKRLG